LLPVAHLCTELRLSADEVLFKAGEMGDAMYVVVEGGVNVLRDQGVIARLGRGRMRRRDGGARLGAAVGDRDGRRAGTAHPARSQRADGPAATTSELVRSLAMVLAGRIRRS
jgi:hypothetical protein